MSGPTAVGRFGPAMRRVLTAVLVTAMMAALTAAALHSTNSGKRSAEVKAATPRAVPVEEATLRLIPAAGSTGAATCSDPSANQEWRVTWRAIATGSAGATPEPALTPAPPASTPTPPETYPTVRGAGARPPTSTPTTPVAGPTSPTPTPSDASSVAAQAKAAALQTQLAERSAGVTLIPTGFAVRPLTEPTGAPAGPSARPTTPTTTAVPTLTATPTASTPPAGPALPGGWQSRDLDRWLLRWTPTPAETKIAVRNEEWVRMGALAALAALPMTALQDPRFVTPDGACTVYLVPFRSGPAAGNNTVAVVGDSLVAQLYASSDGTPASTGPLRDRLMAAGKRVEISGQGGRRWGVKPDGLSPLEQADSTLLDELRGLREARSLVVALGTNDAGWVAHAPDPEQYQLRLAWVMTHLAAIVDELHDHGHCTVLVTLAERNKHYGGGSPELFEPAAKQINDYLRLRADADPNDRLKLWDWGSHADPHGHTDPDAWFGQDTIHLKAAGLGPYADELTSAAALC